METMRKTWTDERLDRFTERADRRFDEVDRSFDEVSQRFVGVDRRFDTLERQVEAGFGKFEAELQRINDRLDALSKAVVLGAVSLTGGMLAGFAAVATLVATHT
jgi:hypothetical protein